MIIKSIKEVDVALDGFDCGNNELNIYLQKYATVNDIGSISKTFVSINDKKATGFVTLCTASLEFKELPKNYNNLPKYPIPAIRIARLAVDKEHQGKGVGKSLLGYAFKKIILASLNVGIKFVVVDAKEEAMTFYEHFGFVSLPQKKQTFILPIEQIVQAAIE